MRQLTIYGKIVVVFLTLCAIMTALAHGYWRRDFGQCTKVLQIESFRGHKRIEILLTEYIFSRKISRFEDLVTEYS
jgi:hypothetical protein